MESCGSHRETAGGVPDVATGPRRRSDARTCGPCDDGTAGTVEGQEVAMRSESTSRGRVASALVVLLVLGSWLAPSVAWAAGRVALVVGNGAYGAIGALPNPGNDAADVSAALGRLGFDVTTVRDADRVGMNEALRVFTRESAGADVALVFLRGARPGGGRRELPRPGGRAPGTGQRRAVRDGGAGRRAGGDNRCVAAGGDPGCCPGRPSGAFEAYGHIGPGSLGVALGRAAGIRDVAGFFGWRGSNAE